MRKSPAVLLVLSLLAAACDEPSSGGAQAAQAAPLAPLLPSTTPAPEPPRLPDIVVDVANVSIGNDRIATGELGLTDRVAVFLRGRPLVAGATVPVVAMRGAKPSSVVAVVSGLRGAKAAGALVRTEARDGTTQRLPLAFPSAAPDCATVAWIGKDASIEVWPAGGGKPTRVLRGLAGPDMTLGTEAIRKQGAGCLASQIYVGADDALTWGLVFDLATSALQAPGARASGAVLLGSAAPGRKLALE